MAFIYSLNCPITNEPKYIGQTRSSLSHRLSQHIFEKRVCKRTSWITSLKNKGLKPVIELLDEVPLQELDFWETHYIFLYRSWGFELKNMTVGGDGRGIVISPMSVEARNWQSVIRIGKPSPRKGAKLTDDQKRRLSEVQKGRKVSAQTLLKRKTTIEKRRLEGKCVSPLLGRKITDEHKEKVRQTSIGRKHSIATKNFLSVILTGRKSPMKGQKMSKEHKQKIRVKLMGNKNGIKK